MVEVVLGEVSAHRSSHSQRGSRSSAEVDMMDPTAMRSDDAAAAGANGYLRKEASVDELKRVFIEVASLAAALGAPTR